MSEKPPLIIKTLDHVEWKPLPQSAEREGMDNAFRKAFEELDRRITQESPPQPADEPKTIRFREWL